MNKFYVIYYKDPKNDLTFPTMGTKIYMQEGNKLMISFSEESAKDFVDNRNRNLQREYHYNYEEISIG